MMSTPVDAETAGMMKTFEASLGELLRCLLRAVEALQTLDIQNLVEYCEGILNAAVTNDVTDMQSQEVLCVSYFHELARNLERLDEDKVMGLLLEHHVVPLLLQHFEAYRAKVTETDVEVCLAWGLLFSGGIPGGNDTPYSQEHVHTHPHAHCRCLFGCLRICSTRSISRDTAKSTLRPPTTRGDWRSWRYGEGERCVTHTHTHTHTQPAAKAIKATESDAEKRKKLRALCDVIIRYK